LDSGAKKVLLPISSAADLGSVPADLIGCFNFLPECRGCSVCDFVRRFSLGIKGIPYFLRS
jgi:hypothetical protein